MRGLAPGTDVRKWLNKSASSSAAAALQASRSRSRCARVLGAAFDIVVADPALATRPSRDPRASAIIAAGRNLFEALGIWSEVAPNAQPILDMIVTDSRLEDVMRPVFLTFAGDVGSPPRMLKPARLRHPRSRSRT